MDVIVQAIDNLIAWFGLFPAWILQLFKNFMLTLYDMLGDVVAFLFDEIFQAITAILALIPIPTTTFNANQYLAGAPSEFIGMLIAIRIPEAFGIIVVALGIRFLLGLIPVIRVGG